MSLVLHLQHILDAEAAAARRDNAAVCRRNMRVWAARWRFHRGNKDQFELAELALGNALGWRDRSQDAFWEEAV
jgi:hypothetical protein